MTELDMLKAELAKLETRAKRVECFRFLESILSEAKRIKARIKEIENAGTII